MCFFSIYCHTIQETVETAKTRMKLFLLHTVLLNKLPLKYRAQSLNNTLLDEFSKTQDGKVYPFHEVSVRYNSIINVWRRERSRMSYVRNLGSWENKTYIKEKKKRPGHKFSNPWPLRYQSLCNAQRIGQFRILTVGLHLAWNGG